MKYKKKAGGKKIKGFEGRNCNLKNQEKIRKKMPKRKMK